MLQIISGKFFSTQDRHVSQGRGILYSNFSWIGPIETVVGTLEPVDTYRSIASYVYSYTNQLERTDSGFSIIRTGDAEIVNHFKLLCMFGLRGYFVEDRAQAEHICRLGPKGSSDEFVPAYFVPRMFAPTIQGENSEVIKFPEFVKKVISLKRKQFIVTMECLKNMNHALEVLSYNLDLSYSMFIYCLESLCQGFDGFSPKWEDYGEKTRTAIDEHLNAADQVLSANIRATLLQEAHVQLQTRFLAFVIHHIDESFYSEEANGIKSAVRPSQIRQALKNAYTLRSKYVHTLQKIEDHLRHSKLADGDVFVWEKEPYLTVAGLHRLVRHVVGRFIEKSDSIDTEEYNWRKGLPGIVNMRLAPEYWIGQHEHITVPMKKGLLGPIVNQKFWGFVNYLLALGCGKGGLPDLRGLLAKYEVLFDRANPVDRVRMLCTYGLYHTIIQETEKSENYQSILTKYKKEFDTCCLETIFYNLMTKGDFPWSRTEVEEVYSQFQAKRFSAKSAELPRALEIGLLAILANMALSEGNAEDFTRLIHAARLEASGMTQIQTRLQQCETSKIVVDSQLLRELVFGERASPSADSAEGPIPAPAAARGQSANAAVAP